MIKKFVIKGLVQGIGYRPWVARLAEEMNISGWVRNTGGIVTVLASGQESKIDELYQTLLTRVPTGGFISSIDVLEVKPAEDNKATMDVLGVLQEGDKVEIVDMGPKSGFKILESDQDQAANLPLIPADIATCDSCKTEMLDPKNRRYGHPFISCTICGPRYSIIDRLPYDRDTITMADFEMCLDCKAEYTKKTDRRRHAQTIACKECGPKLEYCLITGQIWNNATTCEKVVEDVDYYNKSSEDISIKKAIELINAGGILAIKDIGGYHLACNPFNQDAVAKLRILKHREAKAFAVMFYDINQAKKYAYISNQEAKLLESPARPIVLVRRKDGQVNSGMRAMLAENVCLTSPDVGAMLPGNPVQILLTKSCGPLIMTSGNASGDVLETDDEKMRHWLQERATSQECKDISLGQLSHNRRILRPMDDSVMKVVRGRQQFIRRGRGHVPNPIAVDIPGQIFAAGGDLKSTFCYIKNGLAYPSQYLGDLESVSCQKFYKNECAAMRQIFGFEPDKIVVDKHPGYFSRTVNNSVIDKINKLSDDQAKGNILDKTVEKCREIQHHKAHVASVIAEHQLKENVLGFAFDGTGYGDDGRIWGSETFLWDGSKMEHVAHLNPVNLIGGDQGAKNCATILAGFIHANGLDTLFDALNTKKQMVEPGNLTMVRTAIDNKINVVTSTSMGRLFDAMSALLGICNYNSYEGQAPIELENIAALTEKAYPLHIGSSGQTKELFEETIKALVAGVSITELAHGFINAVADYIYTISEQQRRNNPTTNQVVLSGGTFLNRILLERTIDLLEDDGFSVYTAEQLPPGDGGICLGQAFLAVKSLND